jgi:hypothetical protein
MRSIEVKKQICEMCRSALAESTLDQSPMVHLQMVQMIVDEFAMCRICGGFWRRNESGAELVDASE